MSACVECGTTLDVDGDCTRAPGFVPSPPPAPRCACPSHDAYRCYDARYGYGTCDDERARYGYSDGCCCACHEECEYDDDHEDDHA